MENRKERIKELAPCGIYCGACPSFGKSCYGCSCEDVKQARSSKWKCKIRICCYEKKELSYCVDCEEFPCQFIHSKLIKCHPGNPKYTYRHEVPLVSSKLVALGVDEYFEYQKKRWACSMCGGTVVFYHYKCSKCGMEKKAE